MALKGIRQASKIGLSFSGCGFLGAYNFGAAKCIIENSAKLPEITKIAGASAGSLVASLMVLAPQKIDSSVEILYSMADEVHELPFGALTPGYFINEKLVKVIDNTLPEDISKAQEKLNVSVTKLQTWENVLINKFDNRDHLISVLLASCYIPMYSMGYNGKPPIIENYEYIDGGMTNVLPIIPDLKTVTCTPFSSIADICPQDSSIWNNPTFGLHSFKINSKNMARGIRALFPPTRQVLQQYFELGYRDAKFFISNL
ncbi:unnamed protein product [Caenorhabditis angaria]|uniref:PNPLA domain-containing protein n=1 Tax=Caenorhabditis angaria TaxID=860376 RepID=A0A9P1IUM4_9PELO|nr:unnamed protein product [Caenorhabditis angaria]